MKFEAPKTTAFILSLFLALPAFAESDGAFTDVISPEIALTLAQTGPSTRPESLLVLSESDVEIEAINLSDLFEIYPNDVLSLVGQVGYDALADLQTDPTLVYERYAKRDLILAPSLNSDAIAAGTNYPEHGKEAGIDSVFLFPKYSQPAPSPVTLAWNAGQMLDYEVELCVRFGRDIGDKTDFEASFKAFSLCGDFTDRATLLRNIDVSNLASGRGFTDAKSGNNRLPFGAYSVVPRDWRSFIDEIEIGLTVNGEVRQKTKASGMIKPLETLMDEILAAKGKRQWSYQGQFVPLNKNDVLKKGQLVLTGTPEGVVYNHPSLSEKIMGGMAWALSFSFLEHSAVEHVLERQIADGLASGAYLKPGDRVEMTSNYLGDVLVLIK